MSGMRAPRRMDDHDEEHENSERWLLTYADMITLLLALFMVLFALSSVNANKFAQFKTGLTSAFHSSAQSSPTVQGGTGLLSQTNLTAKPLILPHPNTQLQQAQEAIQKALSQSGHAKGVSLHLTTQGLTVRILTDKVFFASGNSQLDAPGAALIDSIGKVVASVPNAVEVYGYTDNTPIGGGQLGNFALSSARANAVLQRLVTNSAVPIKRLSTAGYGSNDPVASNATEAGRTANRRVDIVLLPEGSKAP